jgi:hypothetical protein
MTRSGDCEDIIQAHRDVSDDDRLDGCIKCRSRLSSAML